MAYPNTLATLPAPLGRSLDATREELQLLHTGQPIWVFDEAEEEAVEEARPKFQSRFASDNRWNPLEASPEAPVTTYQVSNGLMIITPGPRNRGFCITFNRNTPNSIPIQLMLVHRETGHVVVFPTLMMAATVAIARAHDGTPAAVSFRKSKVMWSVAMPWGGVREVPEEPVPVTPLRRARAI